MASNNTLQRRQANQLDSTVFWSIFAGLIVLRLINAFSIQTFFQPDEYFQSLEPAWEAAFGHDSGAWLTWEWHGALRSSLHPKLFVFAYNLTQYLPAYFRATPARLAQTYLAAPKALQAIFAAVGDLYTWQFARTIYGTDRNASWAALALTVLSPWQWYCSTRTFSNSLETVITIVALSLWPRHFFLSYNEDGSASRNPSGKESDSKQDPEEGIKQFRDFLEHGETKPAKTPAPERAAASQSSILTGSPKGLYLSLTLAALACILRPTNLLIWMAVAGCTLYKYGDLHKISILFQGVVISGLSTLVASAAVDWHFYQTPVFPPLRFLYFNVVQSMSVFYGRNRHDYYITEGLPLLLTTALPFAIVGMWRSIRPGPDRPSFRGYEGRQTRFVLAVTVLVVIVAMSLISHKEVRFIYPLLPMLHVIAAKPLATFFNPFPIPKSQLRLGLLMLMLTLNVYIAAYVTLVHQRGVIDVMHYLRHEHENKLRQPGYEGDCSTTVGFLMPCHSTPWRSHLIYPSIKAWALSCEPPLQVPLEERDRYQDEADIFYRNPAYYFEMSLKDRTTIMEQPGRSEQDSDGDDRPRREWPEYLVFFEQLEPVMKAWLQGSRYRECWRGFNTHWHDDWRRKGDVIVWCMHGSGE